MVSQPTIYCIHASDAPQHTGELKTILLRMKTENRISDFKAVDISSTPNFSFNGEDPQGIIVLLTDETERTRTDIEKLMSNASQSRSVKLIEIIVDNLPYHNTFISFPSDLKPIRSRDDMNLVWTNIEQSLKELFPTPKVEVVKPSSDPIQIIKPIGVSVATTAFRFLRSLAAFAFYFFLSLIFWLAIFTNLFTDWGDDFSWGSFSLLTVLTIVGLMIFRHRRKRAKRNSLQDSTS